MHTIPYMFTLRRPYLSARYPKIGAHISLTAMSKAITSAFLKFSICSLRSIWNLSWKSQGCMESMLTKTKESMK